LCIKYTIPPKKRLEKAIVPNFKPTPGLSAVYIFSRLGEKVLEDRGRECKT
jgi:hypothetical protein